MKNLSYEQTLFGIQLSLRKSISGKEIDFSFAISKRHAVNLLQSIHQSPLRYRTAITIRSLLFFFWIE